MPKFRKKPVVIEAWENKPADHTNEFPSWLLNAMENDELRQDETDGTIAIQTLEGIMTAQVGDWIIQGVKGELYPCKPDIFEATYEPA